MQPTVDPTRDFLGRARAGWDDGWMSRNMTIEDGLTGSSCGSLGLLEQKEDRVIPITGIVVRHAVGS